MKAKNKIKLGYDISMAPGSLKPVQIQFWKDEKQFNEIEATEPLKYFSDALVGLSMVRMNHFLKSPLHIPHMDYSFAFDAWKALDPHFELFQRSKARAPQSKKTLLGGEKIKKFETEFEKHFEAAQKPWGLDLKAFLPLSHCLEQLESELDAPLLFNFEVKLSKSLSEKLHAFYSFLFHLRSLVAVDYNAHVEDASHEALKVDAICDYLPKAEYIANDAILYWNFRKLALPFKEQKGQAQQLLVNPLEKVFQKYSHNACYLVDHLPEGVLATMKPSEMEEKLYLIQMDWLLGTDAGLLFRIREELFGLQEGYEKLFWPEASVPNSKKETHLCVSCELTDKHVVANQAA